jgi:hypothetical protein
MIAGLILAVVAVGGLLSHTLENFMKTTRMENWIEIEEFPSYHVSNRGRIRGKRGNVIKPGNSKCGYLFVIFVIDGKRYSKYVHRLVLKAFGPEQPPNTTVDHINRIKTDNRLENLRWATNRQQTDNSEMARGSKQHLSKLTESDIPKIRKLLSMGITQTRIAKQFGVAQRTISRIKSKKAWSHVQVKIT